MSKLGGLFNTVTSPFHLKLFSGGPYPDNGYGDKAEQTAGEVAGYGRNLLGKNGGLPGLDQMGSLGYIPGLVGQQAANLGMNNPFNPQESVMANNPYALTGPQGMELNNRSSSIQRAAANTRNTVRSQLAAKGLLNSTTEAAMENAINEHAGGLAQTESSNLANQAFAQRQGQLSDWQNLFANLYGKQLGQFEAGTGMVAGQIPVQQQIGQQAVQQNAATGAFWQSLLAPLLHSTYFPAGASSSSNYGNLGGYDPAIQRQIDAALAAQGGGSYPPITLNRGPQAL